MQIFNEIDRQKNQAFFILSKRPLFSGHTSVDGKDALARFDELKRSRTTRGASIIVIHFKARFLYRVIQFQDLSASRRTLFLLTAVVYV